jgi:hypothetical protein
MNEALFRDDPAGRLHSRYRPEAEAERYIDALNLSGGIAYFILIEPGLGYLVRALKSRYPHSKIIVLHADSRFKSAENQDIPAWYPGGGQRIQDFLEREIPDVAAASVRIIEWRPSLRFYGETCLTLISETAEFIKRADAGFRTAAAFGCRWVKNSFRNIGLIRKALLFTPMSAPVLITGSGPGLEDALPRIRAMQDRVFILAASSSVPALRQGGVDPDMVISADGGSWALSHLYACFRRPPAFSPNLAVAFSAALPSQCAGLPVLTVNDGSLWQTILLGGLGIPSVIIPQRGTVTALALDLALVLSSGDTYLAGLDLSVRDIRTHARPYGFDYLFYGAASRLRPIYSQCFVRSDDTRQGGSHAVYAAWFKNRLAAWPRRIFSLGGNHAVFEKELPNVPAGHAHNAALAAESADKGGHFKVMPAGGEPAANCRRAAAALIRALDDPRYAQILSRELGPLLFPGGQGVSLREIRESLRAIAARYGKENHG